jgi:hypothetical protein
MVTEVVRRALQPRLIAPVGHDGDALVRLRHEVVEKHKTTQPYLQAS